MQQIDEDIKTQLEFLGQEMMTTKETIARLKFELKNHEKTKKKKKKEMLQLLLKAKQKEYTNHCFKFGLVEKSRTAFDQKLFQDKYPDLYDEFKTTKTSETFEFKLL